MRQEISDIIAIFKAVVHPDILLSVTYSTKWKEVKVLLVSDRRLETGLIFALEFLS